MLGYDEIDGELVPNAEADTVRLIFWMFADGASLHEICEALQNRGVKRLRSKNSYDSATLLRMLRNELYAGDLRTWKSASNSFFTERAEQNKNISRYWFDHHSAIIDRETWNKVQCRLDEMDAMQAQSLSRAHGNHHVFYGKLYCSECGAFFKRRTLAGWNGASYKAWNCAERQKGKKGNGCKCRIVKEEELKAEIASSMKWESFDETQFSEQVRKVWVGKKEVRIESDRVIPSNFDKAQ